MASGYTRLAGDENSSNYGTNASPRVGYARGTSTEFFQICDRITTNLFSLSNGTTNLEKSKNMMGTSSDSQMLRDRVTQLNADAGTNIQDTTTLLRSIHLLTHGDKQRKVKAQKLQTDFQAAATRFAEVQKKVLQTVRSTRLPSDMVAAEMDAEASSADQMIRDGEHLHTQRKELQSVEFEVAMQQEREQQVKNLESDIVNINDIMRELSSLVSEQGTMVDSIENNVETTHTHVEEARAELIKASAYQSKYRRRICFLILILIVVLMIVGIILAIHFTSKD